jgi:ankyrin repeat protein
MDNKLIRKFISLLFLITLVTGCSIFPHHTAYFEGVKDRLDEGMDINSSVNHELDTLLHISVKNNSITEVKYLLDRGAEPNINNIFGLPPLYYINAKKNTSADREQAKIIALLVKFGADINIRMKDGITPLASAILDKKPLSVKEILASNADFNIEYNGYTPLMLAVKMANPDIVNNILEKTKNINFRNEKGQSALDFTALGESKGSDEQLAEIARILIKSGAIIPISYNKNILNTAISNKRPLVAKNLIDATENILNTAIPNKRPLVEKNLIDATENTNALNKESFSPLMKAIYSGNIQQVKDQLNRSQDLNYKDKSNWSALHLTTHPDSSGGDALQANIAILLIKSGANINIQGPQGKTTLDKAISNHRQRVADVLLTENINISIKDETGKTALMTAVQTENLDILKKLTTSETVNTQDNYGWSALHFISYRLSKKENLLQNEIVDFLIQSGANVNLQNRKGFTPLHLAIKNSALYTSQALIDNGADITLKDKNGQTPLMHAVREGNISLIKNIIVLPQNLDAKDNNGWTAFHFLLEKKILSSDEKQAEIARLLINAGADINSQTNDKSSALHLAIERNYQFFTQVLINAKAESSLRNNKNMTPLMAAVQNGNLPIVKKLAKLPQNLDAKQENDWTALHFTAYSESKGGDKTLAKIADELIAAGADLNSKINTGETALSVAIGNEYPLVATALLNARASVDLTDNNGWTPIMLAVYLGKIDIIKQALPLSSDLDIKNSDGWAALHLTANTHSYGGDALQAKIATLLIKNGANVNLRTREGSTALHFAAANNQIEVLKALLAANASINIRNHKGWSANDEATKAKNTQIVQLLK